MKKLFSIILLMFVMLTSATSAFAAPPDVFITTPSSTSELNPSVYSVQPPIVWDQYDADSLYFKEYWIIIYDPSYNVIYDSGIVGQYQSATHKSVNVPTLPTNRTLLVTVNVSDSNDEWSNTQAKWMRISP
ncbi:hypothetical protein [Paenibacillus periandrae]|uniref:hypothetical protein n=1 Tax=Paenibacillus periandrae TaxID=1761741 RepID=UPI001F0898ED|nr:hypothetical protein [Paenibacillus periandrae]